MASLDKTQLQLYWSFPVASSLPRAYLRISRGMLFVLLALIAFCLAQCFKQKALSSMVELMDLKFL